MTDLKQKYDATTTAILRQALDEIVADRRFLARKSVTTLEVAEHILQQAASGERDLNRLKSSAFEKLGAAAWLRSGQARVKPLTASLVAVEGNRGTPSKSTAPLTVYSQPAESCVPYGKFERRD